MKTRLTISELEQMKTHELADLLANVVLLLRRMPDVECGQLTQHVAPLEDFSQPELPPQSIAEMSFTESELNKKKVDELKTIARGMNLSTAGKKADLLKRILTRARGGKSEQFAIQDV
ncbi:MAG TPA: SAP domain-containing protein [Ktedonobacteraceae bacterium]|nr:SAP domain-containing protein [Ktedonobacteraceae bacterium]